MAKYKKPRIGVDYSDLSDNELVAGMERVFSVWRPLGLDDKPATFVDPLCRRSLMGGWDELLDRYMRLSDAVNNEGFSGG